MKILETLEISHSNRHLIDSRVCYVEVNESLLHYRHHPGEYICIYGYSRVCYVEVNETTES